MTGSEIILPAGERVEVLVAGKERTLIRYNGFNLWADTADLMFEGPLFEFESKVPLPEVGQWVRLTAVDGAAYRSGELGQVVALSSSNHRVQVRVGQREVWVDPWDVEPASPPKSAWERLGEPELV